MDYSLMLLADPGTDRAEVLRALEEAPDTRRDPKVEHRYWLRTEHGEAQVNVGTKDPVESIHLEFGADRLPLMEAVTRRALELGTRLDMRLEDVQWGHEVTPERLPELLTYWQSFTRKPATAVPAEHRTRPWWKLW